MTKKILIAEDDKAIVEVIKIILETEGYKTFSTDDGVTVVDLIKNEKPDLVLLDIWLSGEDGGKIARIVKSDKEISDVPILLVSASQDTRRVAEEAGADGFLLKPFDIDELLQVVRKHLEKNK